MAHFVGNARRRRRLRRATAVILAAALAPALSVERSVAQVDGLFSGVESAVARGLPAGGPGDTPGIATVRSRLVRVAGQRLAAARDVAAVAGAVEPGDALTLTLNLFADTVLTGIVRLQRVHNCNESGSVEVSGAAGRGSGRVLYMVGVNNGCPRTGTLTIAGRTFTVRQSAEFAC